MPGYSTNPEIYADLFTDLRAFLLTITGLAPELIVRGIPNRVSMPATGPFIIMTPLFMKRLRTNIDLWDYTNPDPDVTTSEMGTQLTVQLDVYGPASGDMAALITTLLRDEVACNALTTCQPLYAEDAKMVPLVDGEQQYEERWTVGAVLQYNPTVAVPMQFADALTIDLTNVDEAYPP